MTLPSYSRQAEAPHGISPAKSKIAAILACLLVLCINCMTLTVIRAAAAEQRIGIAIGNSSYTVNALAGAVPDAIAVGNVLKSAGFSTQVLQNSQRKEIISTIDAAIKNVNGGATVVIFYSGYIISMGEENFIIPTTAFISDAEDLWRHGVPLNALLRGVENSDLGELILILDASVESPFEKLIRPFPIGLAPVAAPRGVLVGYSTVPGQTMPYRSNERSVYAEELVSTFSLPGFNVEEVMKLLRVSVMSRTKNAQVPWQASSLVRSVSISREVAPANGQAQSGTVPAIGFWTLRLACSSANFSNWLHDIVHAEIQNGFLTKQSQGAAAPEAWMLEVSRSGGRLFVSGNLTDNRGRAGEYFASASQSGKLYVGAGRFRDYQCDFTAEEHSSAR